MRTGNKSFGGAAGCHNKHSREFKQESSKTMEEVTTGGRNEGSPAGGGEVTGDITPGREGAYEEGRVGSW